MTGGARSGKSAFAQKIAYEKELDVAYIATAEAADEEMRARIEKHKAERPSHWHTYECPYSILPAVEENGHALYLVDCLTVYISNLIFKKAPHWDEKTGIGQIEADAIEGEVAQDIIALLEYAEKSESTFVIVSNEVGMGIVPQTPLGRYFRDMTGRMNMTVAARAAEAYMLVSGLPVKLK